MITPRRSRLFAGLLMLLSLHHGQILADPNLPDLGDQSSIVVSPAEERRLGEEFMRQARARLDLVADPELNEYLRRLGQRLTASASGDQAFHFFLVNNSTINAFAVPGGFIGVHSGLMLTARNEAEVAAVLAHEIVHITQRHIPRIIAESQRTMGPALAAMLAGILIAASGGQGGEAAIALATAGMAQNQINFTRSFEQEADRLGMKLLDSAGFDVRAMAGFFERLEAVGRLHDTQLPEFLRTHPVTTRRIAEARDHAEQFPPRINPHESGFRHMQARLRVMSDKPETAVRYFRGALENARPGDPAERYGLALALLANRQLAAARHELRGLLAQQPDNLSYLLLRAEIEAATGDTRASLDTYASTARRYPDSLAATHKQADALIRSGRHGDAYKLLDVTVRKHPDEPWLYKLLATAAGESGQRMQAHRAFGEYYYRTGQPRAAVEQLELAIRLAKGNFYYVASLEARIREIREQSGLLTRKDQNTPPNERK